VIRSNYRAALLGVAVIAAPLHAQGGAEIEQVVERVAARRIPPGGPGCTIGASRSGATVSAAFGFADLERRMPLTPTSILEAGSVSKQFTAGAVVLLALDGKLSLDDDIRRYFPELPAYEHVITIRHLLTHTSGLRDWGAIASLEGWPRGTRAYTNAHVLEIAARQRALNHAPGSAYSYTNTGYNLLALLVARVSGQSFADFTRDRLFLPLGMSNTSWRDDHTRLVQGRALAYASAGNGFATAMPNENAHGNGGLLTTVRDLLVWNDAMDRAALGKPFADTIVKRYVLTNTRTINYALGINVVRTRGTLEINHSGSTGGYRAQLVRFPDARVSVAVLCNGASLNAGAIAYDIADALLPARTGQGVTNGLARRPFADTLRVERFAGVWVHNTRRTPLRLAVVGSALRRGETTLTPIDANRFADATGQLAFSDDRNGMPTRMVVISRSGDSTSYFRSQDWRPSASDLRAFTGTFASGEVHGEPFRLAIEGEQLVLRQSPTTRISLTPIYTDAFQAGGRIIWFTRDATGRATTMFVGQQRAWAIAFQRSADS